MKPMQNFCCKRNMWFWFELFQKKDMLRVCSSKNAKIHHFGSQVAFLSQNLGFWRFFSFTPIACPFFTKSRHKITYSACKNSFTLVTSPQSSNNKVQRRLDQIYFPTKGFAIKSRNRVLRAKSVFKAPIIGFWNILISKLTGSTNLYKGSIHAANFAYQQSFGLVLSSKRWKDKLNGLLDHIHFWTNIYLKYHKNLV